jgi:hypothetical protein
MSDNNNSAENNKSASRLGLVILPFIIMLIVGIFIYPAFIDLGMWLRSYTWEVTEGRLEKASVETILVGEVSTESRPDVRYSYSVDDRDYIGTDRRRLCSE